MWCHLLEEQQIGAFSQEQHHKLRHQKSHHRSRNNNYYKTKYQNGGILRNSRTSRIFATDRPHFQRFVALTIFHYSQVLI